MNLALLDRKGSVGPMRWAARLMIPFLASTLACGGSSGGASAGGTGGHVSAATGGSDGTVVPTTAKLQFDGSLSLYRVRP